MVAFVVQPYSVTLSPMQKCACFTVGPESAFYPLSLSLLERRVNCYCSGRFHTKIPNFCSPADQHKTECLNKWQFRRKCLSCQLDKRNKRKITRRCEENMKLRLNAVFGDFFLLCRPKIEFVYQSAREKNVDSVF